MVRIGDLSLRVRLLGAFLAMAALLVCVGGLGFWGSLVQSNSAGQRTHLTIVARQADLIRYYDADVSGWQVAVGLDAHTAHGSHITAQDPNRVAEMVDKAALDRMLPRFPVRYLTSSERRTYLAIVHDWAAFWSLDTQAFALYVNGDQASLATGDKIVNGPSTVVFTSLSDKSAALSGSVNARSDRLAADAAATGSTVRMLTLIATVLALVAAIALALVVTRSVVRPVMLLVERLTSIDRDDLESLRAGLGSIADGDLTATADSVTEFIPDPRRDEIGTASRTANSVIEKVRGSLADYNTTRAALSDMIGQLSRTAGVVAATSQQMSSTSEEAGNATGEIAQAISAVAEGAERQVRMVETTRRAVQEVTGAVKESAEQTEHTAEVATHARAATNAGMNAAEQANGAMRSVRESSEAVTEAIGELAANSQQIGAIVQTITGIAEQTNLLALNAAIEAARAGDQGRGFAVVADEVRKLAEESQHAAHEISQLIGSIQQQTSKAVSVVEAGARRTQDGAAVVEQTREAFQTIGQAVEDMTARIEQIAAGAQQITASANSMQDGIGEIEAVAEQSSASTEQISASAEQTSAAAQQIAASAHDLATNAEQLNRLVARFKTSA